MRGDRVRVPILFDQKQITVVFSGKEKVILQVSRFRPGGDVDPFCQDHLQKFFPHFRLALECDKKYQHFLFLLFTVPHFLFFIQYNIRRPPWKDEIAPTAAVFLQLRPERSIIRQKKKRRTNLPVFANYHTHTYRCGHAEGEEKEYVECAIRAGLKILGFSDHTPYDFGPLGPRNRPMRMALEDLPGYAESLRALAARYRGQIEIIPGVEAEYYPAYFPALLDLLRENGIRYMILGQHFLGNEVDEPYCGRETADETVLARYVAQSAEALHTGLFTYFAHPDLIHFVGDGAVYARQMRRLCEAAKETDTPLEINLLGIREGRHYPDARFWAIAGEVGNAVVLGCDAHTPADVRGGAAEQKALALAARNALQLLPSVPLRKI